MLKPGSTDFSKCGGYLCCCNCNPCHTCKHVGYEDYYAVHGNTIVLGDEIGPGAAECCFLILPPLLLIAMIVRCFDPIYLHGHVFRFENNQVNCEIFGKHCCHEDGVIKIENIVEVKAVEVRRKLVARGKHHKPHVRIYSALHIVYRLPSGEMKTHVTGELKRFHVVEYLYAEGMMGLLQGPKELGPVGESYYDVFCKEIHSMFIARTVHGDGGEGGVMTGGYSSGGVQMQSMDRGDGDQKQQQQQVVQTAVVVGVYDNTNQPNYYSAVPGVSGPQQPVVMGTIVAPM